MGRLAVDWTDWQPTYEAILADFGWQRAEDEAAAAELAAVVPRGAWRHVGTELKHRPRAVVVGCGPALEGLTASALGTGIVVAADGATQRLREIGVVPRVVVTDLDGDPDALAWAAAQGSSLVVHAHGANRQRLGAVPTLGPLVAGSCQCDPAPWPVLRNFGGFTDGDRAVLLCAHFGVKRIDLVAFDFDAPASRYSHQWDPALKPRKLAWARTIVAQAAARGVPVGHIGPPGTPAPYAAATGAPAGLDAGPSRPE